VFLLLGGVVFRRLIRNADTLDDAVAKRSAWLMISGATILPVVAVLARSANVLPATLAVLFVATFLTGEKRKEPMLMNLAAIIGVMIIVSLAFTSHASAEPGVLARASSLLHWIAAVAWGGCLIHLSSMPWSGQDDASIENIRRRYAILAISALALFALSGGLLAFVHVHNADAMSTTYYGRFVMLKAAIVVVLTVTMTISLLARQISLRRFRALLILETILLTGLLVATANLEARDPPGVPPFNNPQTWQMKAGEMPLSLTMQPVAGSSTRVRIEISAAQPDYRFPEGSLAFFDIHSKDREAGAYGIEAVSIGPSGFLGEAVLAIPGEWQFKVRVDFPDGASIDGDSVLTLPALPLQQDLKSFLSFTAVAYSFPGFITFVVGVMLLLSAAWLFRQSYYRQAPSWLLPVSMANIALGAYLALSVSFVKTYPTTFDRNPEAYDANVIALGEEIYALHCAECHGIAGKGDGPWAISERGSIPDLTAPHMDVHTDGEIYWWIVRGIPSLDKPALDQELSESERWAVINFTRSLRHGIPAQ
jgi:putative copper export protein/mono/diheme cytochrome c family protein